MAIATEITVNPKSLDLLSGTPSYKEKCLALRKELSNKIPNEYWLDESRVNDLPKNVVPIIPSLGLLSKQELQITENYDAPELVQLLANKAFTSVQVTKAFCKRAAIAHQLTGCLVDFFEEEALAMAQTADEYLHNIGKTLGPLHGLPISIKDHMPLKGHPNSTGFLSTREERSEEDCLLVSILRQAGAVFYVKTNQPQGIMHLECTSFFYRTLNPHNTDLSSGGSTGGEASLIALRGSVLGLGTDIGGSIRGPSSFCGIWGFKPSSQIVPLTRMPVGVLSAHLSINCCAGPMTVSLDGINLFMKTVLNATPEKYDSQLTRWKWPSKIELPQKKVRIGLMLNDGYIHPQPPVTKALKWAKAILQEKASDRFELVEYTPFQAKEAFKLIFSLYYPTGKEEFQRVLADGGEPELPLSTNTLKETGKKPKDAHELLHINECLQEFREKFVQHFNAQNIDMILGPCFVGPAAMHDTALYWNYTSLWNLMDWPACVFPTSIRASKDDMYEDEGLARRMGQESAKVVDLWKSGNFDNAPINLQLATRRHYDDELLRVLYAIKEIFH